MIDSAWMSMEKINDLAEWDIVTTTHAGQRIVFILIRDWRILAQFMISQSRS